MKGTGTLQDTSVHLLLIAVRPTRFGRPSDATLFETFMAFREGTRASAVPDLLAGYPTRAVLTRGALLASRINVSHSLSSSVVFELFLPTRRTIRRPVPALSVSQRRAFKPAASILSCRRAICPSPSDGEHSLPWFAFDRQLEKSRQITGWVVVDAVLRNRSPSGEIPWRQAILQGNHPKSVFCSVRRAR